MKKIYYCCLFSIVSVILFCGCGKKEKIDNYIIDAEYAIKHGDYEGAKTAYNNILELDKENRIARYGLLDIEEAELEKDENLCAQLHTALSEGIIILSHEEESDFVTPQLGDYSLKEFVENLGNDYSKYVYNDCMLGMNATQIQQSLISSDKSGDKLSGKEIRVALYSLTNGVDLCVYIPGSYNSETGDIISAGSTYKPSYIFPVHIEFSTPEPEVVIGDIELSLDETGEFKYGYVYGNDEMGYFVVPFSFVFGDGKIYSHKYGVYIENVQDFLDNYLIPADKEEGEGVCNYCGMRIYYKKEYPKEKIKEIIKDIEEAVSQNDDYHNGYWKYFYKDYIEEKSNN